MHQLSQSLVLSRPTGKKKHKKGDAAPGDLLNKLDKGPTSLPKLKGNSTGQTTTTKHIRLAPHRKPLSQQEFLDLLGLECEETKLSVEEADQMFGNMLSPEESIGKLCVHDMP